MMVNRSAAMDVPVSNHGPGQAASALPFDEDVILAGLIRWAECEGTTWDAGAFNRMMDIAGRELALTGARAGRMGLGDCVCARFPHRVPEDAPGILILAHLDTVHLVGTLPELPIRQKENMVFGLGVSNMKVWADHRCPQALQVGTGTAS